MVGPCYITNMWLLRIYAWASCLGNTLINLSMVNLYGLYGTPQPFIQNYSTSHLQGHFWHDNSWEYHTPFQAGPLIMFLGSHAEWKSNKMSYDLFVLWTWLCSDASLMASLTCCLSNALVVHKASVWGTLVKYFILINIMVSLHHL